MDSLDDTHTHTHTHTHTLESVYTRWVKYPGFFSHLKAFVVSCFTLRHWIFTSHEYTQMCKFWDNIFEIRRREGNKPSGATKSSALFTRFLLQKFSPLSIETWNTDVIITQILCLDLTARARYSAPKLRPTSRSETDATPGTSRSLSSTASISDGLCSSNLDPAAWDVQKGLPEVT